MNLDADQARAFETLKEVSTESYAEAVSSFVRDIQEISPQLFDWVGIYFKESYFKSIESDILFLGPYIGEATEHTKIPISEGLCGLALREESVVNVSDVNERPEHIACSLKTKSELIIPIQDQKGIFFCELDIDSHTLSAFSKELEDKVREKCLRFPQL